MISPGQLLTLAIEKPVAGGHMLARVEGQIVLVSGAIPGEQVTARVERVGRGVAYAATVAVEEPSPDRQQPEGDPRCGGCLYAHVTYPRQLALKAEVIADAFARIGRITLPNAPAVAPSSSQGYRMRARLHVRGSSAPSFFREGSHAPCDARQTRQLLPSTFDALQRLLRVIGPLPETAVCEMEVSENVDVSERVVHLEGRLPRRPALEAGVSGLSGVTARTGPDRPIELISGSPFVTDALPILGHQVPLRRHVLSFFQGNRYLLSPLVEYVGLQIEPGSTMIDLYAGVGLFSLSAAIARDARVIAVEGDRVAATDLDYNARQAGQAIETVHQPVEVFTARPHAAPDTLIVDPPRTGMSKEAMEGAIALRAGRIIYVSCDVATLARDSRRLLDAGYVLQRVEAFDLFPNTPHVEAVGSFAEMS